MKTLVTALALCFSLVVMAGDGQQEAKPVLEKFKDGFVSPLKDIRVRYFIDNSRNQQDNREIWLYPNRKGASGSLLYSFERDAAAYFSPDEQWIVVYDYVGSDTAFLVLFTRIDDVTYIKSVDPNAFAKELLEQESGIPGIWEKFHHRYFIFSKWAADSISFVIVLHGYADLSDPSLDDWFCTFDLRTMKAYLTPEQREKNKGAVHFDTLK